MSVLQVTTTVPSLEVAERLAEHVVERRVAACAQILGPMRSRYWWNGAIEQAEEWLCILKTSRDRYVELESAIREVHPYQVPEILATTVEEGHEGYLAWIAAETTRPRG